MIWLSLETHVLHCMCYRFMWNLWCIFEHVWIVSKAQRVRTPPRRDKECKKKRGQRLRHWNTCSFLFAFFVTDCQWWATDSMCLREDTNISKLKYTCGISQCLIYSFNVGCSDLKAIFVFHYRLKQIINWTHDHIWKYKRNLIDHHWHPTSRASQCKRKIEHWDHPEGARLASDRACVRSLSRVLRILC